MTDPFFSNKLRRQQHPQQQVEGPEFTVTLLRRVISTSLVTKLFNKVLIYIRVHIFCYKVGTGAYVGQHFICQPSHKAGAIHKLRLQTWEAHSGLAQKLDINKKSTIFAYSS